MTLFVYQKHGQTKTQILHYLDTTNRFMHIDVFKTDEQNAVVVALLYILRIRLEKALS